MGRRLADKSTPADPTASGLIDWRHFDPSSLPDGERTPLAAELITYRDHLDALLPYRGQYVVIKGRSVQGVYRSRRMAIVAAATENGRAPVLIKQIVETEPVRRLGHVSL